MSFRVWISKTLGRENGGIESGGINNRKMWVRNRNYVVK
jgi:hypothetical protein